MSAEPYVIRPFDRTSASTEEYQAWHDLSRLLQEEAMPEDPAVPLEMTIRFLQNVSPIVEERTWAAWGGGVSRMVGRGGVEVWHIGSNEHAAGFHLSVAPQHRQRGLARALLNQIAETARGWDRRLLLGGTISSVPAGDAFMRRIGARPALQSHVNQLVLAGLDRDLIQKWQQRGRERGAGFELGWWTGPYPEEPLDEVAAMKQMLNLMPRGDLEIEDISFTPEMLRQMDAQMTARKDERWTLYARDRETGRIAGYTEVWWNEARPEILQQDDTAVFPDFQNRGLGRWLKAAMLERVLAERPQVRWVRTGNAVSNAPMLKINTEMGFKSYRIHTEWQVERDRVEAYLNGRVDRAL